jgi:single-strand DNA-binding protein
MLNKATLIGNVGKHPESKTFSNGDRIVQLSIATSEKYTDKNTGERKELTEWHNIVFKGNLCDVVEKYVKKGSKLYIEGKIRTRSWDDNGQKRYATEIHVGIDGRMVMLGDSANVENQAVSATPQASQPQSQSVTTYDGYGNPVQAEGDLPF